ncbi:MAG TPA: D-glycero-beta-D-manno-heptose-7-phosphate kinase, partial [Candidatus Methanoperedens sp.]|nr:D-glycero-beta-D-manno-heptose-7-phosphate kinase [Candidatus Methanoperedens sp.]
VASFNRATILVVGDLMVDRYFAGSVRRISPEAPVPIVEVAQESQRCGGAANVARNAAGLGARVEVCGVVGEDAEGAWLRAELARCGIGVGGIVTDSGRPTSLKSRVVAHQQQVVRFDRERPGPLATPVRRRLAAAVAAAWERADATVVSDYGKGVVGRPLLEHLRALARRRRAVPVVVDPKSPRFELYRGAAVITPNLAEALAAAGAAGAAGDVERAGAALARRAPGSAILVTRGEQGMSLFEPGRASLHLPTVAREVFDVTGAGDTVVGVLALALARGAALATAARLANLAAGIVVAEFGTVPVTRAQLLAGLAGFPPPAG